MRPTPEDLSQFLNALQLSIKSQIDSIIDDDHDGDNIHIHFNKIEKDDLTFGFFEKIVPGKWNKKNKVFTLSEPNEINWPFLISFLLVTRLNQSNILKIGELNRDYLPFVNNIFPQNVKSFQDDMTNVTHVASLIFNNVTKQKITIRKLSEQTGLSQVTLSNFKSGGDLKLSNLLKICKELKLKIKITN